MAGPSVTVRILGDLKGLGQSLSDVGSKAEGVASRGTAAFRSWLGGINATGALGPIGPMLDGIVGGLDNLVNHAKGVGPALAGAGAALTGLGAGLSAFGSKEQAAHQQLQQAIENTGKSYDDYGDAIEAAIKHGEKFGKTADETDNALQVLTQATHDPDKALQLLNTTFDLSAAKHEDLTTAATQLGRTYNGNTKLLKEFGVAAGPKAAQATKQLEAATKSAESADSGLMKAQQRLSDVQDSLKGKTHLTVEEQHRLRDAQQRVAEASDKAKDAHLKVAAAQENANQATTSGVDSIGQLSDAIKGQASASADTFAGKLDSIKAKVEDSISQFGQRYGPAIQGVGIAIMTLGTIWTTIGPIIAGMELSTMWPILAVVAAVVALIAIGYLLYNNWDTIWAGIKAAVGAVWDWITSHWPLLLDILLGPVGIAINLIIDHFDGLRNFVLGVVDAIKGIWDACWEGIKAGASAAVGWVQDRWNDVVGFFAGLPGRIASIGSDMWHGILDGFRSVINGVIDLWNRLHFTLPHVDLGPLGTIGGGDIGVPQIPHLAQGGIITRDGLVYAHAGEAITPARAGPSVVIENANFAQELDVDLFMRRAAWVAQTRAM